jgi:hypothetical protein
METVESATSAIPEAIVEDTEEALPAPLDKRGESEPGVARHRRRRVAQSSLEVESEPEEEAAPAPVVGQPATDPWTSLFQSGMALLQQFAMTRSGGPTLSGTGPEPRSLVHRDEKTGETYLKLPVPSPEVVDQMVQALGALLHRLRR